MIQPASKYHATARRRSMPRAGGTYRRPEDNPNFKHGESPALYEKWSPEYKAWCSMKSRCLRPLNSSFRYYGMRGVTIYPEWIDNYPAFLRYVGRKPTPLHTLDRFPNPKGNYEPGNVRWASRRQQTLNSTATTLLTIDGISDSITGWCSQVGLTRDRFYIRKRKGLSAIDIIKGELQNRARLS